VPYNFPTTAGGASSRDADAEPPRRAACNGLYGATGERGHHYQRRLFPGCSPSRELGAEAVPALGTKRVDPSHGRECGGSVQVKGGSCPLIWRCQPVNQCCDRVPGNTGNGAPLPCSTLGQFLRNSFQRRAMERALGAGTMLLHFPDPPLPWGGAQVPAFSDKRFKGGRGVGERGGASGLLRHQQGRGFVRWGQSETCASSPFPGGWR